MFRYSTLAAAALMASPSLWSAFVLGTLDPTDAIVRLLIAVPVAAILLAIPRAAFDRYARNLPARELPAAPTMLQATTTRADRAG
ncbi:hypothetical protein [Actinokineospora terrae]|uniref:Uncharacterized protein n=1 Tax=Actinokineospora terrae TaxID=155974 RepID=A0A1H9X100_9PSEU|nr:hypothetical protein [Actinokineospora terrae]SES39587.1 hypothetical protein SAMN04487818_11288 [Actinokineospora terrae]